MKKDQSVTYLVFNSDDASLVGYFSIAIKLISIRSANISKTSAKKYHALTFLIKQHSLISLLPTSLHK